MKLLTIGISRKYKLLVCGISCAIDTLEVMQMVDKFTAELEYYRLIGILSDDIYTYFINKAYATSVEYGFRTSKSAHAFGYHKSRRYKAGMHL